MLTWKHGRLACAVLAAVVWGAAVQGQVAQPQSVLQGRPDDMGKGSGLGELYESRGAGIALRPPANCKELHRAGVPDVVVEFVNDQQGWMISVSKTELDLAKPLDDYRDPVSGIKRPGALQDTVDNFKTANPTAKVLRQEVTKVAGYEMGLLAFRYSQAGGEGSTRKLQQEAVIPMEQDKARNAAKFYYVVSMVSPGAKQDDESKVDPGEQTAAGVFADVLDTVKLLDRGAIRDEQEQRLFRTRSLLITLKDPKVLQKAMAEQQWLRLVKDGKDVGYSYVTEEQIKLDGRSGVQVSVRSHTTPSGTATVDAVSRMFVSSDWRYETWMHAVTNREGKNPPVTSGEFGISERVEGFVADKEHALDPGHPPMRETSQYRMEVRSQAGKLTKKPYIIEQLPPWYMPQAVKQMLPRMLPLKEPKTYMFSTYVSERGEVMTRYIDVEAPRQVNFAGQSVTAVPIKDRVGLEGVPTTYYVTPEGKYLGSETVYMAAGAKSVIQVIPSDEATLRKMWAGARLTRPEDSEMPTVPGRK